MRDEALHPSMIETSHTTQPFHHASPLQQVESKLPKDKPVLVVCQTGVRSLAACKQIAAMGYGPLAWLDGGLDEGKPGDLPTKPEGKDPRYGGIGGMSESMGWTKVQRENKDPAFLGGVETVLLGVAAFLALDLLSIGVGYVDVLLHGPKV